MPHTQHFAELLQGWTAKLFEHVDNAIAFLAPHAAEKSFRQMFHSSLRCAPQNLKQVGHNLRLPHSLLNELWQAVFDADARLQLGGEHGPLLGEALHGGTKFIHRAKLPLAAGLRAEPYECCAQQCLQFRVGFAAQYFPNFADRQS